MDEPVRRNFKRFLSVGDFHCGHEYGLTPPTWHYAANNGHPRINKAGKFQRVLWDFATSAIDELKPIEPPVEPPTPPEPPVIKCSYWYWLNSNDKWFGIGNFFRGLFSGTKYCKVVK